jgi:hypothetical protein
MLKLKTPSFTPQNCVNIILHITILFTILSLLFKYYISNITQSAINGEIDHMIDSTIKSTKNSPMIDNIKYNLSNKYSEINNNLNNKYSEINNNLNNKYSDLNNKYTGIKNNLDDKYTELKNKQIDLMNKYSNIKSLAEKNNLENELNILENELNNLYNNNLSNNQNLTDINSNLTNKYTELNKKQTNLMNKYSNIKSFADNNELNKFYNNNLSNNESFIDLKPFKHLFPYDNYYDYYFNLFSKENSLKKSSNDKVYFYIKLVNILLIIIFISIAFYFYHNKNISGSDLKLILLENTLTFGIVGIIEYIFFTQVALKYVPTTPSLLYTLLLDSLKKNLIS